MKYLFFPLIFLCSILFADSSIVVPEGDPLSALLALVTNWSAMSPLAIASGVIVLLVQGFKKFFPGFQYLKFVVVFGGVGYGFVQALVSGMTALNAGVFILLTSGGAVAIYELFKTPLNAMFGTNKA